jgi:hypothetical protein
MFSLAWHKQRFLLFALASLGILTAISIHSFAERFLSRLIAHPTDSVAPSFRT